MHFFFVKDKIIEAHIKVIPGASKNAICGIEDNRLKIKIAAAAEDGKANTALIAFSAKTLGCAKSEITLKSGHKSRLKTLVLPLSCKAALENIAHLFCCTP